MATANFVLTSGSSGGTSSNNNNVTLNFISWTPYPQNSNVKTELVNRLGSKETIVQKLYTSSNPVQGTAIMFFLDGQPDDFEPKIKELNSVVGKDCKLKDNINDIQYDKLVITDLMIQPKKVGNGWLLICGFTQFLRTEEVN
jgi:hypothetical protein